MSGFTKFLWGSWSWRRPLYTIAFIYGALAIVAIFFAHKLIFFPPSDHYDTTLKNLGTIRNGDQTIAFVHYPAGLNMPTLLWSHGNAEDIGLLTNLFQDLNNLGYGILAYDYPGYGLSTGKPTEKSCYAAADAAYTHLTETLNVPHRSIVLAGQSVGTGPTLYLAETHQSPKTILIAPFTSIYRVGLKYPIFPRDRFPSLSRIKNIRSSILFIHGETDEVIPQSHSATLIENHSGSNQLLSLPNTGHNDIYFREKPKVIETIHSFLKQRSKASCDA